MKSQKIALPNPGVSVEINDLIIDCILDIKGKNIVKMDLRALDGAPASYFIICEGESSVQVKALSDNIYRRVKKEIRITPNHIEGEKNARWILVDYFDTIVHIFYSETRSFYDLEAFWGDAEFTEYQNL